MTESERKKGARLSLESVRAEAERRATSLKRWVRAWRVSACGSDVLAILLAGFASASAVIALGDVVTAVTAGVAAAAALFGSTVRPGQLAARDEARRGEWATLGSEADQMLNHLGRSTVAQVEEGVSALEGRRNELDQRNVPKRKEYPPLAW